MIKCSIFLCLNITNIFRLALQLGTLVPIATEEPPTTTTEKHRQPFESSNLVNNQPVPMDGPVVSKKRRIECNI